MSMFSVPTEESFPAHMDTESSQAVFRTRAVASAGLICVALYGIGLVQHPLLLTGIAVYFVASLLWQQWTQSDEVGPEWRQWAALVFDQVAIGVLFALGGRDCLLFLWSGPLASIGHGVRFGRRRGMISAFLGGACMTLAALLSPEWRDSPELAAGLILMSVLTPVYVVQLVNYVKRARDHAEARAQEYERQSRLDLLTGLLNRRGLINVMRSLRDEDPTQALALAFVDLDGFKAVNDELGHAVGDQVLKQVAQRLRSAVSDEHPVIRMGGDEFAVLITHDMDDNALDSLGTVLCRTVRSVHPPERPDLRVHASIGIWRFRADEDFNRVLRSADALMYESKRKGRDGFELGGAEGLNPTPDVLEQAA